MYQPDSTAYEPSRYERSKDPLAPHDETHDSHADGIGAEKTLIAPSRRRAWYKLPPPEGSPAINSVRTALRIVELVVAAVVVGVLGHAAAVWAATKDVVQQDPSTGFRLRAWAVNLDMWPTWTMLAAAAVALVIQTTSLLTLCRWERVRRLRTSNWHTWSVFFSSLFGFSVWAAAVIYFKVQDIKGQASWSLWSWSCTHSSLENGLMSFESICVQMHVTFYASAVLAVLDIANLVLFWLILHRGASNYQKVVRIDH